MTRAHFFPFAFLASLAAVAGCDSQVDPEYRGEALATLHGTVVATSQAPLAGDAVLIWQNPAGSPDISIGVAVPVTGSFPAAFTIPIYTPPPAAAVIYAPDETGDDRVAVAFITMLKPDADPANLDDALLGLAEDHAVIYIENELEPGGTWEKLLHGRPGPGYHLVTVVRKTQAEKDAILACNDAYNMSLDSCYQACEAQQPPADACYADCNALPAPDCGNGRDSFSIAPGGFSTSITVTTPPTRTIDWN